MNAESSVFACQAVKLEIKSFERHASDRKTVEQDNAQFVIGCVEVSIEKSRTALKAGGRMFCPLHKTVLKFCL